ncbi:hypothetical protein [Dyadobacter sp. CY343]|uniref:hypothetical protein n=1 Tax=Dyadobacter sp. CY343 TaxID=2907299 RepID=UPI001F1667AE|nr:hypothetical protein [Dyadobacter sp. CY343]MCE7058908.1 hypothetical protein [Dyadobacter sp. CY343]
MKNAWGFICVVLLVVTTSAALPSDDADDKKARKPKAKAVATPTKAAEPAKAADSVQTNMVNPAIHWFGPSLNKKNPSGKDKC